MMYSVKMSGEVLAAINNLLFEEKSSSEDLGNGIVYLGGTEVTDEHIALADYDIMANATEIK